MKTLRTLLVLLLVAALTSGCFPSSERVISKHVSVNEFSQCDEDTGACIQMKSTHYILVVRYCTGQDQDQVCSVSEKEVNRATYDMHNVHETSGGLK